MKSSLMQNQMRDHSFSVIKQENYKIPLSAVFSIVLR